MFEGTVSSAQVGHHVWVLCLSWLSWAVSVCYLSHPRQIQGHRCDSLHVAQPGPLELRSLAPCPGGVSLETGNVLKRKLTLRPGAFCQVPLAFLAKAVRLRVFEKRKGVKGKQPKIKKKLTNTYMFAAET